MRTTTNELNKIKTTGEWIIERVDDNGNFWLTHKDNETIRIRKIDDYYKVWLSHDNWTLDNLDEALNLHIELDY